MKRLNVHTLRVFGAALASFLVWAGIMLIAASLSGCGGGEPDAPAPAPCVPKARVTIGLWGDSTNYGESRDSNDAPYRVAAYPEILIQRAMDARFGAGAVVVTTWAMRGTRLDQLLAGAQGLPFGSYPVWPAGNDDDISVENFGINDAASGVTPDAFAAELRTMQRLHSVVMETPLPANGSDGLAQTVRDVARSTGAPLIDVNAYVNSLPAWSQYLGGDGVHPTGDGYAVITNNLVIPALVPMVAALRCEP